MKQAVRTPGERHDALRTAFFGDHENGYEPTQGTLALHDSPLRLEAIGFNEKLDHYSFDVERARTIHMEMFSESDTIHYVILGFHRIAIDYFCFDFFCARCLRCMKTSHCLPWPFSETTEEQRRLSVGNGLLNAEADFWQSTLATIPGLIPMLPMARSQTWVAVTKFAFEDRQDLLFACLIEHICIIK